MTSLVHEYRGGVLENVHPGRVCIVDDNEKIITSVGHTRAMTYFRSSSKPIQVLPVLMHGLDRQYGLSEEELTIMAASHSGEPLHLEIVLGLLKKTGFLEEDLIMLPTYPENQKARDEWIGKGLPPRKALHGCAGKHIAAMMLSKLLTGAHKEYWKPESAVQKEIASVISTMTSWPLEDIRVGIDGCGVPVFAVPMRAVALSYMRLACPDKVDDIKIRAAIEKFTPLYNRHPLVIEGSASVCSLFNQDPNVVAKGGAQGVYTFGLKKERLGIAIKNEDGDELTWAVTIAEILRQLNYSNRETIAKLEQFMPSAILNDNNVEVGEIRAAFRL